jgi:N6-adenosine-specific RNA methylase IME4
MNLRIDVPTPTQIKQAKRAAKEAALAAKQLALPDKRYGVIVADPPWRWEPYSRETGMDRAADNHYPTSGVEAIAALPVSNIAADACVLFLWATVPCNEYAFAVMKAWGFAYKSQFVWVKNKIGLGFWNRNKHELLLIGTRGHIPAPAPGTQWPSVIDADVGAHSVKPEAALEMIESYYPNLPKIELHRRGPTRRGWDAWGAEAEVDG